MIWLCLSFTEEFVKFTVNYHVVLSPFLSAKVVYLPLLLRKFGPTFESKRRLGPMYFCYCIIWLFL